MTQTNEIQNIFSIPESNICLLEERIAKLNRKANKLNCPKISLVKHGTEIVRKRENKYLYVNVEIVGNAPTLEDWAFIGVIDFTDDVKLIKTAPGNIEIPTEYRNLNDASNCDHCHINRVRNKSLILQHTITKEFKQVGSSCLKDFFGYNNPLNYAKFLEYYNGLVDDLHDSFASSNTQEPVFFLNEVLPVISSIIRECGYVSGKVAYEDETKISTKSYVTDYYFGTSELEKQFQDKIRNQITKEDLELSEKVIKWIKNEDNDSEYFYNLKSIINSEIITSKTFGYVASMIPAYNRAKEIKYEQEENRKSKSNEHVGTIKKREIFNNLTVISKIFLDSDYGTVILHIFEDETGNRLTCFASRHIGLKEGQTYDLKATPKKHDEYKGRNQTILTRVAKVEK